MNQKGVWIKSGKGKKKAVKSALSPFNDRALNNTWRNMERIFDTDWFDEVNEPIVHYENFIEEFTNWLDEHGENMGEYVNKDVDIEYLFEEYMNDIDANHDEIEKVYEQVDEWLDSEEESAASLENASELYAYSSGATDIDFYIHDVEENARRQMRDGDSHGFSSAADIVEAVNYCIENGDLVDVDAYDGGSYGYHPFDEDSEYFETGSMFTGNGEEELQLQTDVPFSEKNDYGDIYRRYAINGDCIYVTTTWVFIYGVPWSKVEDAGDELGLRKNASIESRYRNGNKNRTIKSSRRITSTRKVSGEATWDEIHSFLEREYYDRISQDLNDLLYQYQKELGIMTGDTQVSIEPAIDTLIDILTDQY